MTCEGKLIFNCHTNKPEQPLILAVLAKSKKNKKDNCLFIPTLLLCFKDDSLNESKIIGLARNDLQGCEQRLSSDAEELRPIRY